MLKTRMNKFERDFQISKHNLMWGEYKNETSKLVSISIEDFILCLDFQNVFLLAKLIGLIISNWCRLTIICELSMRIFWYSDSDPNTGKTRRVLFMKCYLYFYFYCTFFYIYFFESVSVSNFLSDLINGAY